jgi:hypothetical protein
VKARVDGVTAVNLRLRDEVIEARAPTTSTDRDDRRYDPRADDHGSPPLHAPAL